MALLEQKDNSNNNQTVWPSKLLVNNLECLKCKQIPKECQTDSDGNIYCQDCSKNMIDVKPNKAVQKMINQLKIKCINHDKCHWIGLIKDIEHHLSKDCIGKISKISSNPYLDESVMSLTEENKTESYENDVDIDDEKMVDLEQQKLFRITSEIDLKIDDKIKSSALYDESGFNLIPMDIYNDNIPKPIINLTLDLLYDNWTKQIETDFLKSYVFT